MFPLPVRTQRPIFRPTRGRRPRKKKPYPFVFKKKPPRFGRVAVVFYLYPSPMAVGAFFCPLWGSAFFTTGEATRPQIPARHGGRVCRWVSLCSRAPAPDGYWAPFLRPSPVWATCANLLYYCCYCCFLPNRYYLLHINNIYNPLYINILLLSCFRNALSLLRLKHQRYDTRQKEA